ncbi:MAG TPA: NIPSNAP family protein [Ramlibacter sp.]|nr:NIPSNAP family protein [Ramlibacter sp.]
MIVEMRTYALHPGQQGGFMKLMEHEGIAIERRILRRMLGFYTSEIGALNQVVHLWGYESFEERQERRAALAADPQWAAFVPKVLPLIREMENKILTPAPFAAIETLDWSGAQFA